MSGDATERAHAAPSAPRPLAASDLAAFRRLAARQPVESELQGPSMGAGLPGGTRIRIVPMPDGERPRAGQVVAFAVGTRVMVHRVAYVGLGPAACDHLITQGDGNWLCDPPIGVDRVAGIVDAAFLEGAWRPLEVASAPDAKRRVAGLSLALMRRVLEASPSAAARLARVMSYARMGARIAWSKRPFARAGRAGP